jgi:hypothetical protein
MYKFKENKSTLKIGHPYRCNKLKPFLNFYPFQIKVLFSCSMSSFALEATCAIVGVRT